MKIKKQIIGFGAILLLSLNSCSSNRCSSMGCGYTSTNYSLPTNYNSIVDDTNLYNDINVISEKTEN